MKNLSKLSLIAIGIFINAICSCHSVKSPSPMGLKPIQISKPTFTGTWVGESGDEFEVKLIDAETAKISITYNETKTKKSTLTGYWMVGKQFQYASVAVANDGSSKDGYFFVCLKHTPTKTLVWLPDRNKFTSYVQNGIIEGQVVKADVLLDSVTPKLIDLVESNVLFDWQNPMVFKKKSSD